MASFAAGRSMPMRDAPRIVLFCHSLESDWNHGNAHFLRGIAREFAVRGFDFHSYEPRNGWSANHLVADHGEAALQAWRSFFPPLSVHRYDIESLDLDQALDGAALVLVHEWTDPALIARIGRHRRDGGRYLLLFHDTHHRAVSEPIAMAALELDDYDAVLAFGEVLRNAYLDRGWTRRAFTWHEAADTALFRPTPSSRHTNDLVWVGNWGDGERTVELNEFLLGPINALKLKATIHGVRYPASARRKLGAAGIAFSGYLPNHRVPEIFAGACMTVHVPRRPYTRMLPGIPTIRVFEALACGIPLVSAPWDDVEELFMPGDDYLVARDGAQMRGHLRSIAADPQLADALAAKGLSTIRRHHTCAHRVDELLAICGSLGCELAPASAGPTRQPVLLKA
jgi:spore maturation protein CgeB